MADGGRPITAADLGTLFADRCLVDKTRDAKDAASRGDAHRDQRDPEDEPDRVEDLLTASIAAMPRENADGDPPPYGRRLVDSWRPADDSYFGGGGAFPEIPVVQFPSAIGWDAKGTPEKAKGRGVSSTQGTSQAVPPSPASLDLDFDQLQTIHARMMLRLGPDLDDPASVPHRENLRRAKDVASRRTTKEWDTLVSFCANVAAKAKATRGHDAAIRSEDIVKYLLDSHPNAREITCVDSPDPQTVTERYLIKGGVGAGEPVVVTDGGRDWARWSVTELGARFPKSFVRCNDRAPARREDESDDASGGAQRSCALSAREYAEYCANRADAPFYGNGLQHDVFAARDEGSLHAEDGHLTVTDAFPSPKFTSNCDQVREIVTMTHQALIPNAPPGMGEEMATSLSGSLSKVFVGPCGTVTRLHQDCANAHAWLGQASGRKLFVCFPPSDAVHLDVIGAEKETRQSTIDPLAPKDAQPRGYLTNATPTVFVLEPGEVVLVPCGWWHYAAALDPSVTVMRNFFTASPPSNHVDLVGTIIQRAKQASTCC